MAEGEDGVQALNPIVIDISEYIVDEAPAARCRRGGEPCPTLSPSKLQAAEAARRACQTHGIFQVKGHGIMIGDDVLSSVGRFFALPDEQKRAVPFVHKGGFTRGYIPMFGESGRPECVELKEGFSYGYPWDASRPTGNPMQGPNVWPEAWASGEPETRPHHPDVDVLVAFFFEMVRVSRVLCRVLSLALGQDEGYLNGLCGQGGDTISLMRAFHYLPLSTLPSHIDPSKAIGSSPHTDWGFLTVILPEPGVPGLEIRDPASHRWLSVSWAPGSLLVNCGDFLSLHSRSLVPLPSTPTSTTATSSSATAAITTSAPNHPSSSSSAASAADTASSSSSPPSNRVVLHSPVHRVTLSPSLHRTSLVFFYYPSYDARMPTLPARLDVDGKESGGLIAEGKEEKGGPQVDDVRDYNTLLDHEGKRVGSGAGDAEGAEDADVFGEYLMRKWAGVRRDGGANKGSRGAMRADGDG